MSHSHLITNRQVDTAAADCADSANLARPGGLRGGRRAAGRTVALTTSKSLRARRITIWLPLLVLMALCMPRQACAQGTWGLVPEPISTGELVRYMERLGLSVPQQAAVESMHKQYKQQYRALRDGDIEELLVWQYSGALDGTARSMDKRNDKIERINKRITAIERRLFDSMVNILTDQQQEMLPRVRLQRERRRLQGNSTVQVQVVDFLPILRACNLSPQQKRDVDPPLENWERRVTSSLSDLLELKHKEQLEQGQMVEVYQNIMNSVPADASAEELAQLQQDAMQAYQDAISGMFAKSQEKQADLYDLAAKTYRRIQSMLTGKTGARFRGQYYQQAYPELGHYIGPWSSIELEDIDAVESITAEQRDRIVNEIIPLQQEQLDGVVAFSELIDEQRLMNTNPYAYQQQQDMQVYWEKYSAAQQECQTRQQKIWELVSEILTGDQLGAFNETRQERVTAATNNAVVHAPAYEEEDDVIIPENALGFQWGVDQFLANPMSEMHARLTAHVLNVDDGAAQLIDKVFADYQSHFEAQVRPQMDAYIKHQQSLWVHDEKTGEWTAPKRSKMERHYELRDEAREMMQAADARFFDAVDAQLGEAIDDALLDIMRNARTRDVFNRGNFAFNRGWMTSQTVVVDLMPLAYRLPLGPDDRAAMDVLIGSYDAEITAHFERRFMAEIEYDKLNGMQQYDMPTDQTDPMAMQEYWEQLQEKTRKHLEAIIEATDAIASITDTYQPIMFAALSQAMGRRFQDVFNRLAYPHIWVDTYAPMRQIDRARRLDGLTSSKSGKLETLAGEYILTYTRLAEEMTALSRKMGEFERLSGQGSMMYMYSRMIPVEVDMEAQAKHAARQRRFQVLLFDRNELCAVSTRKLGRILDEDQLARVGGLPPIHGY